MMISSPGESVPAAISMGVAHPNDRQEDDPAKSRRDSGVCGP